MPYEWRRRKFKHVVKFYPDTERDEQMFMQMRFWNTKFSNMITPNEALLFIKDHHNGEIPYMFGKHEYARWMAEFANHTLTKHLHKHGVVRGGANESEYVPRAGKNLKYPDWIERKITPPEMLPAEGADLTVCDGIRG